MTAHRVDVVGVTIGRGSAITGEMFDIGGDDLVAILHGQNEAGLEVVTCAVRDEETGLWNMRFTQEYGQAPLGAKGLMDDPFEIAKSFLEDE